jgi:hypothetical protein
MSQSAILFCETWPIRWNSGTRVSGSGPALQQLLADVRAGQIDIVLVYKVDRLTRSLADTRIFEERRKTMSFVCEVPVLIEQRLFALARAIQQSLE